MLMPIDTEIQYMDYVIYKLEIQLMCVSVVSQPVVETQSYQCKVMVYGRVVMVVQIIAAP